MEGVPVRFYCYRYQNYWEAELPVSWIVREHGKHATFATTNSGGAVFSLWTTARADWENSYQGTEENRQIVLAQYRVLNEEDSQRLPTVDCGLWNKDFQIWFRTRGWRFSGHVFFINVIQSTKSNQVDPVQDAVVDRFVRTLSLIER